MSRSTLTVESWMTRDPRTIEHDATLARAHEIMRNAGIRHLPVLEKARLAGILSQRDLHLIETLRDVDPEKVRVMEAMTTHPYFVAPDEALLDVVEEMSEHKFGAAVVMQDRRVIGMFTTTDALGALAELLRRGAELPPRPARDRQGRAEGGAGAAGGAAAGAAAPPRRGARGAGRGRAKHGSLT